MHNVYVNFTVVINYITIEVVGVSTVFYCKQSVSWLGEHIVLSTSKHTICIMQSLVWTITDLLH